MTTHFITAEIDLSTASTNLVETITSNISQHGEPLRWAITAVEPEQGIARVEAVVTLPKPVAASN